MTAPICPYCGSTAKLIDSAEIYGGRSFGPAWACANYPTCDAYVGCHGKSTTPLGRLANRELRQWKKNAHSAFDQLWKSYELERSEAYAWLAKQLRLAPDQCHIGMFDVDVCKRVVELMRDMNATEHKATLEAAAAAEMGGVGPEPTADVMRAAIYANDAEWERTHSGRNCSEPTGGNSWFSDAPVGG